MRPEAVYLDARKGFNFSTPARPAPAPPRHHRTPPIPISDKDCLTQGGFVFRLPSKVLHTGMCILICFKKRRRKKNNNKTDSVPAQRARPCKSEARGQRSTDRRRSFLGRPFQFRWCCSSVAVPGPVLGPDCPARQGPFSWLPTPFILPSLAPSRPSSLLCFCVCLAPPNAILDGMQFSLTGPGQHHHI